MPCNMNIIINARKECDRLNERDECIAVVVPIIIIINVYIHQLNWKCNTCVHTKKRRRWEIDSNTRGRKKKEKLTRAPRLRKPGRQSTCIHIYGWRPMESTYKSYTGLRFPLNRVLHVTQRHDHHYYYSLSVWYPRYY